MTPEIPTPTSSTKPAPSGATELIAGTVSRGATRPETDTDAAIAITADDLLPSMSDEEFLELGFDPPGSTGPQNLPAELCGRPQWVAWCRERRDGKLTKVPYAPTQQRGSRASVVDATTWDTFAHAVEAAEHWADGIGFVFTSDDPFVGVDLDGVVDRDKALDPEVLQIIRELNSYTERSPSGTGLHIVAASSFTGGRKTATDWGGFEVYGDKRFLTMTGDLWLGTSPHVERRSDELAGIVARVLPRDADRSMDLGMKLTAEEEALVRRARGVLDQELLDKARRAGNGEKFRRLFDDGDTAAHDGADHSPSAADMALGSLLAFWTGPDPERVERLMWESRLARDKWESRRDLPQRVARKAVEQLREERKFYGWPGTATPSGKRQSATTIGSALPPADKQSTCVGVGVGAESPTAATPVYEAEVGAPSPDPALALDGIGRSAHELCETGPAQPAWLVPGLIARGWMTKLAAREKTGKGTFVMYLLGKLERAESTVFGPPASEPITALIYTEEPEDSLHDKLQTFGLQRATVVFHWELRGLEWKDTSQWLVAKAVREGHGLTFVDNISRATATDEEAGTELARKAEQLSDLAKEHGMAVLIDHHHRKSGGKLEDRSRGGTALAGACENNVELERKGDWESRERSLASRGRVSATIWEKTVELSEDGTDYWERDPEDFRVRKLRERAQWTVSDFADAIDRDQSTARKWLNGCAFVSRVEGSRGGRGGSAPVLYRVKAASEPEAPAL